MKFSYQAEMKVIMKRYGYYTGKSKIDKRSFVIKLDMVNHCIELFRETKTKLSAIFILIQQNFS